MKLALHLTSTNYVYDFTDMGVTTFICGSLMSDATKECFDTDTLTKLVRQVPELYVLVNALYDEHELDTLKDHLQTLADIGVTGVLFQDFAVLYMVKDMGMDLKLIYSPPTLNTNANALETMVSQGIDGAFLAREIPLDDQLDIRAHTSCPLMIQGHGVEFMSCSKRPLLQTYAETANVAPVSDTMIRPQGEERDAHIFETSRGTAVYTKDKLYTLDLMNTLKVFDWLYIETLYMEDMETVEVTSMYQACIDALAKGTYDKEVKEYLPLLTRSFGPLERGFLNDTTLYHLEDVRRRDNEGKA